MILRRLRDGLSRAADAALLVALGIVFVILTCWVGDDFDPFEDLDY